MDVKSDVEGTIEAYSYSHREWYGLKDGTPLDTADPRGCLWRKMYNDPAQFLGRLHGSNEDPQCEAPQTFKLRGDKR